MLFELMEGKVMLVREDEACSLIKHDIMVLPRPGFLRKRETVVLAGTVKHTAVHFYERPCLQTHSTVLR